MIRNYFIVAIRNLRRNKVFSIINICGLALSLTCCLLIFFFVTDELSYDKFHPNSDRLYKVVDRFTFSGQSVNSATIASPTAPAMMDEFEEVESFTRINKTTGFVSRNEEDVFEVNRVLLVDSAFFDLFGFKLLKGNPKTVLNTPHAVVLSASLTTKLFGDEDPVGRQISISILGGHDFHVTGLASDPPGNSHIQFDILVSHSTMINKVSSLSNWLVYGTHTYVLLKEGASVVELTAKIPDMIKRQIGEELAANYSHHLVPVTSIYLGISRRGDLEPGSDIIYVYIFSITGVLILLLACANFINLSTAIAMRRAREIGIRKVVGSQRYQLIIQFTGEAILTAALSTALAAVFVMIFMNFFNTISGKSFSLTILLQPVTLIYIGVFVVSVGILAGLYPALVVSRFNAVRALKDSSGYGSGNFSLRKALVVLQFVISIVLIASIGNIKRQVEFFYTKDLGFDKKQVLVVPINSPLISQKRITLKSEFMNIAGVNAVATSSSMPSKNIGYGPFRFEGGEMSDNSIFHSLVVDADFIHTLGLEVLAGRAFIEGLSTDSSSFILNEAAVFALGIEKISDAIGKRLEMGTASAQISTGKLGEIVGVVRNFNFKSLHNEIEPIVLQIQPAGYGFFSIKINSENLSNTLANIESVWKYVEQDKPFVYSFLDQDFDNLYKSEQNTMRVFSYLTLLAVIIACLGLFGLSTYSLSQRSREIGIRKVHGAGVLTLLQLLTKDYFKLIGIAFILAVPLAHYASEAWLNSFAFRTSLSLWTYIFTGMASIIIALSAIAYQTLKAAHLNPTRWLRTE
ncbi:MAG TPA: ABC transporter permease [Saprospiraceae bacterium]|nr:ABC transporter permease [Saprospiraceae bacterium]